MVLIHGDMLDREFVIAVEEAIHGSEGYPIIILEHNNDKDATSVRHRCQKCDHLSVGKLSMEVAITRDVLICPSCKSRRKIAHMNMYVN